MRVDHVERRVLIHFSFFNHHQRNSPTRTSRSSTPAPASCPWPTRARAPTAASECGEKKGVEKGRVGLDVGASTIIHSFPNPKTHTRFFLCTATTGWLDGKHVVFGSVTAGMDVVKKIESYGSGSGATSKRIVIADCGQLS